MSVNLKIINCPIDADIYFNSEEEYLNEDILTNIFNFILPSEIPKMLTVSKRFIVPLKNNIESRKYSYIDFSFKLTESYLFLIERLKVNHINFIGCKGGLPSIKISSSVLANLRHFSCFTVKTNIELFKAISIMPKLESLTIRSLDNSSANGDGVIAAMTKGAPNLQELTLSKLLGNKGLNTIANQWSSLQSLSLIQCPISDEGIDAIPQMPNLRKLKLSSCGVSELCFATIAAKMPNLLEFCFDFKGIIGEGFETIIAKMQNLSKLRFENACLSPPDFENNDNKLLKLKSLEFVYTTKTERCLKKIADKFPNIFSLDLSGSDVGDTILMTIADNWPNLKNLNLSDTECGQLLKG